MTTIESAEKLIFEDFSRFIDAMQNPLYSFRQLVPRSAGEPECTPPGVTAQQDESAPADLGVAKNRLDAIGMHLHCRFASVDDGVQTESGALQQFAAVFATHQSLQPHLNHTILNSLVLNGKENDHVVSKVSADELNNFLQFLKAKQLRFETAAEAVDRYQKDAGLANVYILAALRAMSKTWKIVPCMIKDPEVVHWMHLCRYPIDGHEKQFAAFIALGKLLTSRRWH